MKLRISSIALVVISLLFAASCESEDSLLTKSRRPSTAGLLNTQEYFERCEAELGAMPEEIDCKSGERIEFDDLQTEPNSAHSIPKCANPSYGVDGAEGCKGESYLVRQKTSSGSDVVSVCRFAGSKNELSVAAVIAHNATTGATCFYQFKKDTPYSVSGKLPGPKGSIKAEQIEKIWESPAYVTQVPLGTCVECHSAYPWVRNPFVLGTSRTLNSVPENGNKVAPYWVVARRELEQHYVYKKSNDSWERATELWTPVVLDEKSLRGALAKESTLCLSCHRLGRGRFLKGWSALAVGYHSFSVDRNTGKMEELYNEYAARLADSARKFPKSNWHESLFKTGLHSTASQAEWREKLKKPMELVYECGTLPKNCVWKALPEPQEDGSNAAPILREFPYRGTELEKLKDLLYGSN